nr:hypothetical protein [uncultured archaeon]AQS33714.1 hypothetical protein [uncultured archaeon]
MVMNMKKNNDEKNDVKIATKNTAKYHIQKLPKNSLDDIANAMHCIKDPVEMYLYAKGICEYHSQKFNDPALGIDRFAYLAGGIDRADATRWEIVLPGLSELNLLSNMSLFGNGEGYKKSLESYYNTVLSKYWGELENLSIERKKN